MIYLLSIHNLIRNGFLVQLDELEPLFEPQPVPFSFNTTAWYVLGGLVVVLGLYMLFLLLKKHNKNSYRRDALKVIDALTISKSNDLNSLTNDIRIVLKQVAIHKYGRRNVAALYGKDWLQFLESKGKDTPFSHYNILINQDTFSDSDPEKQVIIDLVEVSKKWIKTHA